MPQSVFQEKFNRSIVTALLFNNLSLIDMERKLQDFMCEAEERYDMFCDNIARLLVNKGTENEISTLYLTIDGFSFISAYALEKQRSCVPVLTINKYSPQCPDISAYIEIALSHFSLYCNFAMTTYLSFENKA